MATASVAFTPAEAAALLGLPERQIRKEVEHKLFGTARPLRLAFPALVYLEALRLMDLELGVGDRKKLLTKIRKAMAASSAPEEVQLTAVLSLKLGPVVRDVVAKVEAFTRWKDGLVSKAEILGGEPVFARSRLAVRHVGALAERGERVAQILEDYPYLTERDVEFARLYARAYPRLGRPRASRQAAAR
jgi:uncharacterized protein (DUF433 family)